MELPVHTAAMPAMLHRVNAVAFPRAIALPLHWGRAGAAQLGVAGGLAVAPLKQRASEALAPGIQSGLPLASILRRLQGERRGHLTSELAAVRLLHLRSTPCARRAARQPQALGLRLELSQEIPAYW